MFKIEVLNLNVYLAGVDEVAQINNKLATLQLGVDNIMSAISDFAVKQKAHNYRVDVAIAGLTGAIQGLNDLIKKLQNSSGQISAEDQATLDSLDAAGESAASKLEALDALTPPVVPAA